MTLKDFSQILTAAKSGEDWAWSEIYSSIAPSLTGYLAMRGALEPEDETSETLLSVARNISTFEGDEAAFRSWVFVIAHRRMIDGRRRKARRVEAVEMTGEHPVVGGNVELEAIERLGLEDAFEMLECLTDEQREVVTLRLMADMSLEETANVMGKRVGSVKALQRRAIASLRRSVDVQLGDQAVSK